MPSTTEITVSQLSRLIGLPHAPIILDVRGQTEFAADPRLIPGAQRYDLEKNTCSLARLERQSVIVVCQHGLHLSQGVSAWLRHRGIAAQTLEGGFAAWRADGHLLIPADKAPARDAQDRTVWVTRARPKIVRIACPWLIRRFIDREAVFLFVAPSEVMAVAKQFHATPFDVRGALGRQGRQVHL
jgi:rhodanese-related sulfurtransferase